MLITIGACFEQPGLVLLGYIHIVPDPLWIRYNICTDRLSVHTVLLSRQVLNHLSVQVLYLLQEQVQFWIRNGLKLYRHNVNRLNGSVFVVPAQCEQVERFRFRTGDAIFKDSDILHMSNMVKTIMGRYSVNK